MAIHMAPGNLLRDLHNSHQMCMQYPQLVKVDWSWSWDAVFVLLPPTVAIMQF